MAKAIAIFGLIVIASSGASGQSLPAFEVASVRMNRAAGGHVSAEFLPGGERFTATNASLGQLIVMAYGITPLQLGPVDPFLFEKYDIQAKAGRAVTRKEMLLMLQALLRNRFGLSIRREMRDLPAYALVVNKRGPRLRVDHDELPWDLSRVRGNEQGSGRLVFQHESMEDFAFALSTLTIIGRVVVDKTGLTDSYNFELNFMPPNRGADPAANDGAPSIFTALQEQLGLRLESRQEPVEFLVIEHIERPAGN
jgi:uncharacterized protein (TIGR03435 family)